MRRRRPPAEAESPRYAVVGFGILGVGVVRGVEPVELALRGQGGLRHHVDRVLADRLADRVGGGVHRDLKLLVPQLRLLILDLIVELIRLVAQLEALLPELEHQHGEAE